MATLTSTSAARDTPGRVVPGPLTWSPPERPNKNLWALIGAPLVLLVVVGVLVSQITLPYVKLAPGDAEPINQLLKVPNEHSNPPKGSFLLTTVTLQSVVRPLDLVRDYFDSDIEVIERKAILGDSTQRQYNQAAAQEMDVSKQDALVAAFRTLGYDVPEHGSGALISAVLDGQMPATGVLVPGDAVTAIDGVPTPVAQRAIAILQKHKPGETILLTVATADKETVQRTLRLGSRDGATCTSAVVASATPCMGVGLSTKDHRFDFPFKVTIDTRNVGGPSAGLAFALALIDEVTPGELTGGRKVAVTGTIAIDGTVGDVGGVVQKTAAVRRAGAALFLVPPGEYDIARKRAGKALKVLQVSTLTEALAALAANGGDPVPAR